MAPRYKLWWFVGISCYGLGTLMEGLVMITGWNVFLFKFWYVIGAVVGGWPLAQGVIYQLVKSSTAQVLNWLALIWILALGMMVISSPIHENRIQPDQLNGNVLQWTFLRNLTPILNIYSFLFLVGGALFTAYKYFKSDLLRNRFLGNLLLATGALLPGIGGYFSKLGYNEVLYTTESLGIILIFRGFMLIRSDRVSKIVKSAKATDQAPA